MTTTNEQHTVPHPLPDSAAYAPSRTAAEHGLPVGTLLAEFEITGIIGEGGFGTVYLAMDRSLQRTVAIKEYMPGALASRGADKSVIVRSQRHQETFDIGLKSFINEARLLAQFDHPALIKVHRFWEENKTGYMAMRFYDGQTLKQVVRRSPHLITENWLKFMLKPILAALDALYKVQILHRDVSPDNIMIQTSGEAVLLDFGAARQIIGEATQALTVILKPGYAPIEQYADDTSMKQGPWTDIYALSAVIYYAITSKPPPTSVARMIKDPIEPLHHLAPSGYSQAFLAAIDCGLCIRPDDRPQSIEAFMQLLGLTPDFGIAVLPTPGTLHTFPVTTSKGHTQGVEIQSNKKAVAGPLPVEDLFSGPRGLTPSSGNKTVRKGGLWPILIVLLAVLLISTTAAFVTTDRFYFEKTPEVSMAAVVSTPVMPSSPPLAQPEPAPAAAEVAASTIDAETVNWESLIGDPDATSTDWVNFIQKYPSGKYTKEANARLTALNLKILPPSLAKTTVAIETTVPKPMGTVALSITPWGKVIVDGVLKGVSPPLKNLALPEGKHELRIINPNFFEHRTQIEITKNSTGTISHEFSSPTN
ncbi:MAG: serine/threonine protein kinase [Herminiimonas sp.]|nr:serine/threonine protein kinase [Herminiimonas sp.]